MEADKIITILNRLVNMILEGERLVAIQVRKDRTFILRESSEQVGQSQQQTGIKRP